MGQAERILNDYYLTAPLAVTTQRHLVKPNVKGWGVNNLDYHPSRFITLE
jgi:ABC-type oligopeptide transport system substrate-binding subunit